MGRQITTKKCTKCGEEKPIDNFGEYTSTCGRGPYVQSQCISCRGNFDSEWHKSLKLQHKYGINLAQYNLILKSQKGVCAICGQPEANHILGGLSVDHDHKTFKIRGLLCKKCNLLLGYAKDKVEILKSAIAYLERNQ